MKKQDQDEIQYAFKNSNDRSKRALSNIMEYISDNTEMETLHPSLRSTDGTPFPGYLHSVHDTTDSY